jgi:multiple sugar transport system permease protein
MNIFNKPRMKTNLIRAILIIALFILIIVVLYPLYITIVISLDDSILFSVPSPPPLIPKQFSLFFYRVVFDNMPFLRYYFNTFSITIITFVLKLVLSVTTAYAFSKGKFRGKNFLFILMLSTMMMPFQAVLLPSYMLVQSLHLINSWAAIIFISAVSPLSVFLLKQFMDELPDELMESAKLDGANELTICLRIYLPLCGPVIATIAILTMVGDWNSYIWPSLVLNQRNLFTIPVGLAEFSFDKAVVVGPRAAGAIAGSIPIIILFLILQKYIVQSIASSGIKQ